MALSFILLLVGVVGVMTTSSLIKLADQPFDSPQVAGVSKTSLIITDNHLTPPHFSSPAVLAMDFDTGQILYQKNAHQRMYPASTTKILTALVAVDHFKDADSLEVTAEALVGGSSMGLKLGEKLTFRSLLYGMLLNSGNDASYTLAINYPGGFEAFVAAMNEKATQMGLADSHFTNPAGFDNPDQYSSTFDLAKIAREAAQNRQIQTVVETKQTDVYNHNLFNLNKLLNLDGVIGFKTGTTEEAGQNFVGLVERKNHKVITVVLGSQDRFAESKKLMDWVYTNYNWVEK